MILTHALGWWCVYDGYMFELGLTASGRQRIDRAELDGIVKHDESATIALPSSQLIVNISMP